MGMIEEQEDRQKTDDCGVMNKLQVMSVLGLV